MTDTIQTPDPDVSHDAQTHLNRVEAVMLKVARRPQQFGPYRAPRRAPTRCGRLVGRRYDVGVPVGFAGYGAVTNAAPVERPRLDLAGPVSWSRQ